MLEGGVSLCAPVTETGTRLIGQGPDVSLHLYLLA